MSKLDELIEKLCPNGVEYYTLDNVCSINTGNQLNKSKLLDNAKYPVINGGVNLSGYWHEYNTNKDTIIISQGGASAGYVNFMGMPFWAGAHCYVVKKESNKINYRYLYHFLKSKEKLLQQCQQGAGIPSLSKKVVYELNIPIPPLEIQSKIVHILDNFTELSKSLLRELKTRQKQYRYYTRKLLKFNKNSQNVNWVNLGEYCTRLKGTAITARKMKEIVVDNGKVRIFAGGKTLIDTDENNIKKEDIIKIPNIIVQSRGVIDFIYYDKPCSFKKEMWSYTNNSIITLKFIYYYLKTNVEYFRQKGSQMGSMPQISLDVTEKFKIPIPSLREQERIVKILDKFDKLCNDISEGLPAEIETRQKQYEYYRDELLEFKKL